jgi:hypothetical protein
MANFTIYDVNDNPILTAPATKDAIWTRELMKSNFIYLPFKTAEKIILPVLSYIVFTYKIDKVREVTRKFYLMDAYEPTQVDEMSWKYTPEFQHPEMVLSRVPFFIFGRNSKGEEIKKFTFPYYGTFVDISNVIKTYLNDNIKLEKCGWNVIFLGVSDKSVNISFNDNDFRSALSLIAKAISDNCEWHIDYDNEIIYFGYICFGNEAEADKTYYMEDGTPLGSGMGCLCSLDYKQPKSNSFLDDETFEKINNLNKK